MDQALAIARREADLALERRILAGQAGIYFIELRYQDSLECSLQSIRLSPQNNDPRFVRDDSYWNVEKALIALGDVENARDYAAAHLKLAEQLRDRFSLAQAFHAHEVLALLRGDWDEAREFSDRGLEVDPRDARLVHNRAVLEYQVGNFVQGMPI